MPLTAPTEVRNTGTGSLHLVVSQSYTPGKGEEAEAASGLKIDVRYRDMNGAPLDPRSVAVSTDFYAVVTVTNTSGYERPGRLGDHLRTGPFDGHLPRHPRRPGFELLRPPERRKQRDPDQTHGDLQGPLLPPLGLLRGDVRQLGAGAPEGRMGRGRRADAGRKLNDTALK